LKILHLLYESEGDYFGIGGVAIRAYEIYDRLKKRHEITLLCKRYPGAQDSEIKGLKHIFAGTESKSLAKTLISYAWHSRAFVYKYGKNYDIIVEEFSPAIPTFLNLYKEKPVVIQIQGYTGKSYFEKYPLYYSLPLYLMEKTRPNLYKNIILVSAPTKRKYNIHNSKNIAVISNGVSSNLFSVKPNEGDYILYLGRIDIHGKGLDILLKAYSMVFSDFPHTKLVIAGDGRDREKFIELLSSLPSSIRDNIKLAGWVEGEEKLRLLRDARFVAITSRYESQGIVSLEAMACGKALLVSDIPEFDYIVKNGIGISFTNGNIQSLAEAIVKMLSICDCKKMGHTGRIFMKELNWDRVALQYEEFLENLIKGL